ncbi:adenylate kinase-domain-containing protein [Tribonema minus]|uniref:GTP:AMP phosphotransferase, mitochondrial n=1 Tax=Tribonema minus TaxID=303371 RepID=A0A835YWM7_9STRA|nr:adenylate kinase-domain-containing protein [Tribonema minus]
MAVLLSRSHGLKRACRSGAAALGSLPTMPAARSITALIMGAPGSGKGTISSKILKDFPFTHVSTGDLLREETRAGTKLGLQAKSYMERGTLVPDTLMVDLVSEVLARLRTSAKAPNLLLDGFPRTLAQALVLDEKIAVDMVLSLDVPRATIVERLTDRWVHPGSGRVYAYSYRPPQKHGVDDATGEELVRREDDSPEVVEARLAKYEATAAPLLAHYAQHGIVHTFSGTRSDEIYVDVHKYLAGALPAAA